MKDKKLVFQGVAISVVLFVILDLLKLNDASVLKIEWVWIVVGLLPILIALFLGGYIKKVNVKGFEVETIFSAPTSTVTLTASDVRGDIKSVDKMGGQHLRSLSAEYRRSIIGLRFMNREKGFYNNQMVAEYLRLMPNLEYLLALTKRGSFVGLLPVKSVCDSKGRSDSELIDRFLNAAASENLQSEFPNEGITLTVHGQQSLVDVLEKMKDQGANVAAVVSPAETYLGIVKVSDIERRIAETVIAAHRAKAES